jgi:hypothetical protein
MSARRLGSNKPAPAPGPRAITKPRLEVGRSADPAIRRRPEASVDRSDWLIDRGTAAGASKPNLKSRGFGVIVVRAGSNTSQALASSTPMVSAALARTGPGQVEVVARADEP